MSNFSDIYAEVKAACLHVDSAPVVWTALAINQQNIVEQETISGSAKWIIDMGRQVPELNFSINAPLYRLPISICYIVPVTAAASGMQGTPSGKLEALRDYIQTQPFTTCQQIERGMVDTSISDSVMRFLAIDIQSGLVGGTLAYEPGFLFVSTP